MATDYPITPAVRALRASGVSFTPRLYDYVEHGGTARSSEQLGVSEHEVVKTLVMHDEARKPLLVLMHGDREVSAQALARLLGVKRVEPCPPPVAQKHTGYLVGGTSPFGTRAALSVYAERSIGALKRLFINGGKRGFLVELTPAELLKVLPGLSWVDVATPR